MTDELHQKSVHDLRIMAQAFGVDDIFEKDAKILIQEIEIKQQKVFTPAPDLPPRNPYDARLMSMAPSDTSDPSEAVEVLEPLIKLGLKLTFEGDSWFMQCGKKSDSGTLRMPVRHILACAEKVMV